MNGQTTYTLPQRIMLQHAYVPKLVLDSTGILVSCGLLWRHELWWGLVALFGFSLAGTAVAWRKDIYALAGTPLGRWMLYQAKPVNLAVRAVGTVVFAYGIWQHSAGILLVGAALIVLARLLSKR